MLGELAPELASCQRALHLFFFWCPRAFLGDPVSDMASKTRESDFLNVGTFRKLPPVPTDPREAVRTFDEAARKAKPGSWKGHPSTFRLHCAHFRWACCEPCIRAAFAVPTVIAIEAGRFDFHGRIIPQRRLVPSTEP